MIVSAISFSTVSYFYPHSIYVKELHTRGEYVAGDQDKKVLSNLNINHLIEKDFKKIPQHALLTDLVKIISISKRNIYPVIGADESLVGIVTLDDVRDIMFDATKQDEVKITSLMSFPPEHIEFGEDMASVMHKFETSQAWNLPVSKAGKYIGFVSKSRIFSVYRKQLINQKK
jgi:CIC family chloride channel protein